MPIVTNPDSVLWRYMQLRQRLGSPSARSPIVDRGLVFGDKCPECKAKDSRLEQLDEKSGASRWVCGAEGCGQPWPVDVAFLLRNEFSSSRRPDASSDLYADLGTYSKILDRLLLREKRIYLLLYLYEDVGGYEKVAFEANQRWPSFRPPYGTRGPKPARWSKWTVQRVITDGRRRIRDDLRARGLAPRVLGQ